MFKIAGAVFCVMGCFGYGYLKVLGWKRALTELNQWLLIFQKIKSRLSYQKETLEECCLWVGDRENSVSAAVVGQIGRCARENRHKEFSQIWREETEKWSEQCMLHKRVCKLLQQFPEYAKEADEELQMNLIALYLEELQREKVQLERQIQEKQKPVVAISLIGGVIISILLV